jgi:glutamine synthetase
MTESISTPQRRVDAEAVLDGLRERGVRTLRVTYPDLHGIQRGKDLPLSAAAGLVEDGVAFCSAIMTTDLAHTPVVGGEAGYPDLLARPDLSTAVLLPWAPDVAICLADLVDAHGAPHPLDPRGAVRRAAAAFGARGLHPVVAPELEFFLFTPDESHPEGARRYVDTLSSVYTVGAVTDPRGISLSMLHACDELGLGAFAVNHEFMNAQYEINLRHGPALDASDRAFRMKAAVKEMAVLEGLRATFMGKPFNDQGGSGMHVHLSFDDGDGANALDAPDGRDGLDDVAWRFVAGVLEHAGALMAILNPTINAYKRIVPDSLAPTGATWGHDNRTTFVRVPAERGRASRVEIRVGDGAANPYLAVAALLWAGLDGVDRELPLAAPVTGDAYVQDAPGALPASLTAALDALDADAILRRSLGGELVDAFLALKRFECDRYRRWVTDWEKREYMLHL